MMKAVAQLAGSKGIPCEVSLEHTMACGIGACLCCVVETTEGNKTTCVEGPVFSTGLLKNF
jgi:dihydroorotate dehydrogenase electron transfer subunit